jgi:hypothetical protein
MIIEAKEELAAVEAPKPLTELDGIECIDRLVTHIIGLRYEPAPVLEYVKTIDIRLVRHTISSGAPTQWHEVSKQYVESLSDDQARMMLALNVMAFLVGRAAARAVEK